MRIAAVVVTHNRLSMLKECISALSVQTLPCVIFIVDNASDDGTAEWASARQSETMLYLPTGTNLGGAGGFQFGMNMAVTMGFDRVWVMDDDCVPAADALERLMEADTALGGSYGFLSSLALWTDGSICRMNRQKLWRDVYSDLHLIQHALLRITQATFVSCLFTADAIRQAGLPIGEFFIWGDDIEYTRRLAVRMSLPSYLVGNSTVTHRMAQNDGSSVATDDFDRIPRYRLAYRNEHYLYRKEGFRGFLYYFARCLLHTLRVVFLAREHRLCRIGTIWLGFFRGFFFKPSVPRVAEEPKDKTL